MFKTHKLKMPGLKLFALMLFVSLNAICQNNLNIITENFNSYRKQTLVEKIYVHTDKNFYSAGEIMWFKLYNTDATFHKPINVSKVAYVEVLDKDNNAVMQAKIGLVEGEGNGSLYIPQQVASGNYKFRAYTNWMKNFDADYYFEKNITILNVQKMPSVEGDTAKKYDIRFFPEGGDLINGLQSKVAFKATDQYGAAYDFTGSVTDGTETIADIKPQHDGMGNFIFTPQVNHTYKAVIKTADGKSFSKDLPVVYANGYNMQVTTEGEKLLVVAQCNISAIKELSLLVHTRNALKYTATAALQNGKASFTIDKSVLGDGVSQLTIFNDQLKPVSERLYFKRPSKQMRLDVNSNESVYAIRNKVNIDVAGSDSGNVSIAVYRLDPLQTLDDKSIEAYMFLSSDLKGNIDNAAYYLTSTDDVAADNLMLTQGWRRFKWNEVMLHQRTEFKYMPEFNGHLLTGTVKSTKTNSPQKFTETYLSVPGAMTQFRASYSDENGNVKYEMPNFYGGNYIVAQPNTLTDSVNKVYIDDPFSKEFSTRKSALFQRPINNTKTVLDQNLSMQVQNIYTAEKQRQFYIPANVDTLAFYQTPDLKYKLDDYTRFTSMEEVLREYVAMVNVTRKGKRVYLPIVNPVTREFFQSDPLVLMDGVPFLDFNKLLEFDPLKVRDLEVITQRYILGSSVFEGALNYKTYAPTLSNFEFPSIVNIMEYEGLQIEREFYAPDYSTPELQASHLPDFRTLLQWSPNVRLNGKEKQTIEFYTSDLPGKYAVVVEGISNNGKCGSRTIMFDVKKPAQ